MSRFFFLFCFLILCCSCYLSDGVGLVFFVVWSRSIMIKSKKKNISRNLFLFCLAFFSFLKRIKRHTVEIFIAISFRTFEILPVQTFKSMQLTYPHPFRVSFSSTQTESFPEMFLFEHIPKRMLSRSQRSSSLASTLMYSKYTASVITRTLTNEKNWKHPNSFFSY